MIVWLNDLSAFWFRFMLAASIQNSIYIAAILLMLHIFRDKDIRFLRTLTILGLIKLFIPPFITSGSVSKLIYINAGISSIEVISSPIVIPGGVTVSYQSWFFITWIIIVVSLAAAIMKNSLLLRMRYRPVAEVKDITISTNRLKRRVKFYITDQEHSPYLFGFFRYKVFLPFFWNQWSPECKEAVITHELTHIKQKDPWLNLAKMIVLILNFYNPLIWVLGRQFTRLSEMVCDDYTTSTLNTNSISYSKHLIQISEDTIPVKRMMKPSLAFSESYKLLKDRISRQLNRQEENLMKNLSSPYKIASLIIALVMFLFSWQLIGSDNSDGKIYRYGEIDKNPEMIKSVNPVYPEQAKKHGIQGTVEVLATIDEQGRVIEANIKTSLYGYIKQTADKKTEAKLSEDEIRKICTLVDYACIEAAKSAKFKPGEHKGEKVKVFVTIPYKFKLH